MSERHRYQMAAQEQVLYPTVWYSAWKPWRQCSAQRLQNLECTQCCSIFIENAQIRGGVFVSAKLKERLARMPDELGSSFFILFVNWLQAAFISLHLELWLANLEKFLLHHCHCQPWVQQSTPDQYDQRKFRGRNFRVTDF